MRAQLLKHVRPLIDRVAGELVDLLVADIERRLEQLGEAFAVSISTFASELASEQPHDVRGAGLPLPGMVVPEPAIAAEQGSTSTSATAESQDREPLQRRTVPRVQAPAGGRKPHSCRKCGTVGFTAATCGKTHNVSTTPATDAGPASTSVDQSAASAPASSSLISSPPPPSAPGLELLPSPPRSNVARLPSASAKSAPDPSFVLEDRREENAALSSLTSWRKSHG